MITAEELAGNASGRSGHFTFATDEPMRFEVVLVEGHLVLHGYRGITPDPAQDPVLVIDMQGRMRERVSLGQEASA